MSGSDGWQRLSKVTPAPPSAAVAADGMPTTTATIPRCAPEGPHQPQLIRWHARRYIGAMQTADANSTLSQLKAFFTTDEAPIRVTLVIVVCAVGVLMVTFDTAERSKAVPPAASSQLATHQ